MRKWYSQLPLILCSFSRIDESKNICHMIPHLMLDPIFRWKGFYEISFVSQQVCQAFSWRQCMWFVWNRTHSQRSLQVKDQQSQSFCSNFVLLFKSQKYQKIGILGFGKRLVDWCVVFFGLKWWSNNDVFYDSVKTTFLGKINFLVIAQNALGSSDCRIY